MKYVSVRGFEEDFLGRDTTDGIVGVLAIGLAKGNEKIGVIQRLSDNGDKTTIRAFKNQRQLNDLSSLGMKTLRALAER